MQISNTTPSNIAKIGSTPFIQTHTRLHSVLHGRKKLTTRSNLSFSFIFFEHSFLKSFAGELKEKVNGKQRNEKAVAIGESYWIEKKIELQQNSVPYRNLYSFIELNVTPEIRSFFAEIKNEYKTSIEKYSIQLCSFIFAWLCVYASICTCIFVFKFSPCKTGMKMKMGRAQY